MLTTLPEKSKFVNRRILLKLRLLSLSTDSIPSVTRTGNWYLEIY